MDGYMGDTISSYTFAFQTLYRPDFHPGTLGTLLGFLTVVPAIAGAGTAAQVVPLLPGRDRHKAAAGCSAPAFCYLQSFCRQLIYTCGPATLNCWGGSVAKGGSG